MAKSGKSIPDASMTGAVTSWRRILPKFSATDLMVIVGLAVVLTILKTVWGYVEAVISTLPWGAMFADYIYGVLVLCAAVAAFRVRKIGTNFLVNIIQGFASLLLGAPMSVYMVIYAAGWGITADAVMTAGLFRRKLVLFIVTGLLAGVIVGAMDVVFFREWYLGMGGAFWLYTNWAARILGGLTGYVLGFYFSKALTKAGVIPSET